MYVELQRDKIAELGINPQIIANALKTQNNMTATGEVETSTNDVFLRVSGVFDDIDAIREMPINANGKVLRLGDIARVQRQSIDPAKPKM